MTQCISKEGNVVWEDIHISQSYGNISILSPTVFLCHTGNPVIDSHSCRKSRFGYIALLKQTKHSMPQSKGKVVASELINWYDDAMKKFHTTNIFKEIGFIIFTNRDINEEDRKKALSKCPNLIIICKDNLEKYVSHIFLYRGLVDEEYRNDDNVNFG